MNYEHCFLKRDLTLDLSGFIIMLDSICGVLRKFLGVPMPAPYWDTLIAGFIINSEEEHGLKYLYNKYIAVEDEGVNRFDSLFKGITFDYIPLPTATVYAR